MHLLKVESDGEIHLVENFHDGNTPPYAILSHTWGPPDEEVTFDGIKYELCKSKARLGYKKIQYCARQAIKDGLGYFWVDTCCIDKATFSELSESVTLMFSWYQKAAKCYVYLSDVPSREGEYFGDPQSVWEAAFRRCRWFTRGWTLQELLAPTSVEFFSRDWHSLGDKSTLAPLVSDITTIPIDALLGTTPLSEFSPKDKIQWASSRQTTKVEDEVYCLLGIFDIYLIPHYGERGYAWHRFERELGRIYGSQAERLTYSSAEHRPGQLEGYNEHDGLQDTVHNIPHLRWEKLAKMLNFHQLASQQFNSKAAYSTTCQWLLQNKKYVAWMDPEATRNERFIWLKGKPGVGKSTLVKFAHARASASGSGEIVISYSFDARGSSLERSTQGMYRSLLSQLLRVDRSLLRIFGKLSDNRDSGDENSLWTIELLRELFTSAVGELSARRTRCFIDALDGCDEREIWDMVLHLENLGRFSENQYFFVCFASRHYPIIKTHDTMELIVEDEPGHGEDITRYILDHLQIGEDKTKALTNVQIEIESKARGVFTWVVLVVDILNREFCNGRIFAVQKRLREIPIELSELFRDMIRRDDVNTDDLLLCIQWILFARRPLKLREFYFAMVIGLDPDSGDDALAWDPETVSEEDMRRFVIASSKGLAELTKPASTDTEPTVQFIHESVRVFLVRDGGLLDLWPKLKHAGGEAEGTSHGRLRRCCQSYLKIDLRQHMQKKVGRFHAWDAQSASLSCRSMFDAPNFGARSNLEAFHRKFPFLDYAAANIFYHAEEEGKSVCQDDLLHGSSLSNRIGSSLRVWSPFLSTLSQQLFLALNN